MLYEALYIYFLAPYLTWLLDTVLSDCCYSVMIWLGYRFYWLVSFCNTFFLYWLYTSLVIYFMYCLCFVQDAGVHALSNVCHVDVERISKRKPGEVVCMQNFLLYVLNWDYPLLVKYMLITSTVLVRLRTLCFPLTSSILSHVYLSSEYDNVF